MAQKTYQQTITAWQKEKNETIRGENGWLALTGLFWLKLGKNHFGSDQNPIFNYQSGHRRMLVTLNITANPSRCEQSPGKRSK
jgi:uncharacterized protein